MSGLDSTLTRAAGPGPTPRRLALAPAALLVALVAAACWTPSSRPGDPAFPRWLPSPPDGATPELASFDVTDDAVRGVAFHQSAEAVEEVVAHYSRRLDRDDWRIQLGEFDGPSGAGVILTAEHRKKPRGFHLTISPAAQGSELIYNFTYQI